MVEVGAQRIVGLALILYSRQESETRQSSNGHILVLFNAFSASIFGCKTQELPTKNDAMRKGMMKQ